MTDYKPKEWQDLEELYRKQNVRINELEQENKKLKECNKSQSEVINNVFIPQKERLEEENETLKDNVEFLHSCLDDRGKSIAIMQEENKKLKETIKDHQLYEEKLEHRIIEFEELLHWE